MTRPPISRERAAELAAAEARIEAAKRDLNLAIALLGEQHKYSEKLTELFFELHRFALRIHKEIPQ